MKHKSLSATNIVISFTIIIYFILHLIDKSDIIFGLNQLFFKGFYFQVITTIFVHANLEHLFFNMVTLWQFGNLIEEVFGKIKLLLLYFIGGILSSFLVLIYIYYQKDFLNIVGASSAISVLLGFIAIIDSYNRKGIIIWFLLITFVPLLFGEPIAWFGHIAGFIIGILVGFIKRA